MVESADSLRFSIVVDSDTDTTLHFRVPDEQRYIDKFNQAFQEAQKEFPDITHELFVSKLVLERPLGDVHAAGLYVFNPHKPTDRHEEDNNLPPGMTITNR